jgi:hypothetical protein
MKTFIAISLLSTIASSYSKEITDELHIAQSIRKSATHIRATSSVVRHVTSDEVCEAEVLQLESNSDLTSSLDTLIADFDASFNENFHDFCSISMNPSGMFLECALDYKDYSSDYISLCTENNGVVHNIRFLSICQADNFDMEIELSNLPSCFGQSCDGSKIQDALALILDVTEKTMNEENSGLKCSIVHDYDMTLEVSDTPKVVGASTYEEESGGYDINKKSFLRFVSALVAGSTLLF